MSIDDRLRASLPLALDDLRPDVEQSLVHTLQRVDRRRGMRRGRYAVALVAAAAVVAAVVIRVDDAPQSLEPTDPSNDQVLVLDSQRGSADEPSPLEAATYALGFIGASGDAPWAAIEVPAGWGHDRLHLTTGPDLDPHLRRLETFTVSWVAPDPCREGLDSLGPEVADLMTALGAQRTVRPGDPRPVTLGGYAGQVLRVHVPRGLDVSSCAHDQSLWPFWTRQGAHGTVFPGWTYSLWVLDVEGERLVIMAAHGPDATAAERAELDRMIETLEFIPLP